MTQSDQNDSARTETVERVPSMWVPAIVAAYHAIGASLTVRFSRDGTATIVATFLRNEQEAPGALELPRTQNDMDVRPRRRRRSRSRVTSHRENRKHSYRRARN